MKEFSNKTPQSGTKLLKAVICVLIIALSFACGFFVNCITRTKEDRTVDEIVDVINKLSINYTSDGTETGDDKIKAVVDALLYYDEYARYYTPEEYSTVLSEVSGSFSGIGISFIGKREIYAVTGNSPAYKAGIQKGDVIEMGKKGDGVDFTAFTDYKSTLDFLDGVDFGEEIILKIYRKSTDTRFDAVMVKGNYTATYVEYYDDGKMMYFYSEEDQPLEERTDENRKMIELAPDTAYIVYSEFNGGSAVQLGRALNYMKKQGKTKLIFDLRDNGGGFIEELLRVTAYFVNQTGRYPVVYVEEKNGTSTYNADGKYYKDFSESMTVLANYNTASASECFIGALLSYGDKVVKKGFSYDDLVVTYNAKREDYSTYGKGIMQMTTPLLSGGALKLTVAKVLWPNEQRTCIQGVGINQNLTENCVDDSLAVLRGVEILSQN